MLNIDKCFLKAKKLVRYFQFVQVFNSNVLSRPPDNGHNTKKDWQLFRRSLIVQIWTGKQNNKYFKSNNKWIRDNIWNCHQHMQPYKYRSDHKQK